MPALRAAMPETTVCEQCDFRRRKYEVGAAWKIRRAKMPSNDSELGQMCAHFAFSRPIIRGPYRLHVAPATWRCLESILHNVFPHRDFRDVVYNVLPIE
jgi:hypothetical protein